MSDPTNARVSPWQAAITGGEAGVGHTHQEVGDHWEPKDAVGPSGERAAGGVDPRPGANGVLDTCHELHRRAPPTGARRSLIVESEP